MEAALMAGSEPAVRVLAARGAKFPADPRLARLFIEAAKKGQGDLVGWLVQHSPHSVLRLGGDLALASASREAPPALVAVLVGAGAKGDVVQGPDSSDQGETALTIASRRGREDFVAELLAHGAAINSRNAQKQTALHVAAAANRPDVVRLLLARGADPALTDNTHCTPLDLAVLGSSPEAAEVLRPRAVSGGNDPEMRGRVLEAAIAQDMVDVVVALAGDVPAGQSPMLGGWSATALADACGATKTASALREKYGAGGSSPLFVEAKALDQPPALTRSTPIEGTNVLGRRKLRVSVVIDPEGRIRAPHFIDRPDVDDSGAILGALAGWRFAPPTRQGNPVATRVVLPLQIGVEDRSFFDVDRVEEPPILLNDAETIAPDSSGGLAVKVVVNAQGLVREARVIGAKPEHPCLAQIRQWRFSPARHKGVPVTVSMVVRVAPTP
jgi:ankyrin repeat protein